MRQWHFEESEPGEQFWSALEQTIRSFMRYCSAPRTAGREHIDAKVREVLLAATTDPEPLNA
jgi:hypothetical protein